MLNLVHPLIEPFKFFTNGLKLKFMPMMECLPPFLRFGGGLKHGLFPKGPNTLIERHGLIENSVASLSTMSDQTLLRHDL